jgi:hypothetical protein
MPDGESVARVRVGGDEIGRSPSTRCPALPGPPRVRRGLHRQGQVSRPPRGYPEVRLRSLPLGAGGVAILARAWLGPAVPRADRRGAQRPGRGHGEPGGASALHRGHRCLHQRTGYRRQRGGPRGRPGSYGGGRDAGRRAGTVPRHLGERRARAISEPGTSTRAPGSRRKTFGSPRSSNLADGTLIILADCRLGRASFRVVAGRVSTAPGSGALASTRRRGPAGDG